MVLKISLYSSKSPWLKSDYPYTHHSLTCCNQSIRILITVSLLPVGTQTIPLLITVCLMVLNLSLYSPQSPWWSSHYSYTHHSLLGGTQTIPILITVFLLAQAIPLLNTVSLVVLRLYLYSSHSLLWPSDYPYTHHSITGGSYHFYTHHSLPGGTQTILIFITDSLVVLRLSLYSSQSLWWPSDYPYTHLNLPGVSDNLYTHHCLPSGTQTIPILITVSTVVLRLSLYSSQSLWWYSYYPYTHHSEYSCWSSVYPYLHHILFDGSQTKPLRIIVSLVDLGISPYPPQST